MKRPKTKRPVSKQKPLWLMALLLSLAMLLPACEDDPPPPSGSGSSSLPSGGGNGGTPPSEGPSADGPCAPPKPSASKPWSGPGANPLVGFWGTESVIGDFRYDQSTGTMTGGGGTGSAYHFFEDGTYYYYIVSTGYGLGSISGWTLFRGNYKSNGDQITLYNRCARGNINNRGPSDWEPSTGEENRKFQLGIQTTYMYLGRESRRYEFAEPHEYHLADGIRIQNTIVYPDGSVGFDWYSLRPTQDG